jgi:SAM-dependent methyltransferase
MARNQPGEYGGWVSLFDRLFSGGAGHAEALMARLPRQDGVCEVLEVGCGTGRLAVALHQLGADVTALDAEMAMVTHCRRRYGQERGLSFLPGRMDGLDRLRPGKTFGGILCIGNTLAHCRSNRELQVFLRGARERLKPGGVLGLGLVNMEPLLLKPVSRLPVLTWHGWRLERCCRPRPGGGRIEFRIRLLDPVGRIYLRQQLDWLVLEPESLRKSLLSAGFGICDLLNQPGGRSFENGDAGFFLLAEKKAQVLV